MSENPLISVIIPVYNVKEFLRACMERITAQTYTNLEILLVDDDKRVSSDFCSSEYSSIIASDVTQVVDKNLLKVMAWYDNEWGYSNRLIDLCVFAAKFQGIK